MKKMLLLVVVMAFGIAGCSTEAQAPESTLPTTGAPSAAAATDEFGEMMREGAQAQIEQRPEDAAALAADFAAITGEQVSVVAAQQMSNIVCLDMEKEQSPGALGKVSAAMATETGVSVEMMTRVAERAVAYRCPELSTK